MRHAISVLLENEVGALTRMTGMFSSRGYNIESLNVAPTNDATVSRVTLVVSGSDAAIAKLVDVVNIHDMTLGEHFERELAIIKMKLDKNGVARAAALAKKFGADVLDDDAASYTLQLTGPNSGYRRVRWRRGRHRAAVGGGAKRQRRGFQGRGNAVVLRPGPSPFQLTR
jgi:acetolactate synthase-1/3 small subunit